MADVFWRRPASDAAPVTEAMLVEHYKAHPCEDYEPYDAPGVWEDTKALLDRGVLELAGFGQRPRFRLSRYAVNLAAPYEGDG